jgi:hypothetical protein
LPDYQLTFRRAFLTYGIPQILTLDHGTVFYDNTTPSPFPTKLPLCLLALGVQALLGQTYTSPADVWAGLDARPEVLNRDLPSRALSHQAPLQAYPHAIHSGRMDRPEWEEDWLCLERVWSYLQQGRWFRSSRCNGVFSLGSAELMGE